MSSYNKVVLMGNLTRDPEIRYTPSGVAVAGVGIAVNERFRNKEGEIKEKVCFVELEIWGKQAEAARNHLKKGSGVLVDGSLKLDQWETDSGDKRQKHSIKVSNLTFLPKRDGGRPVPDESECPAAAVESDGDIPF